MHALCLAAPAGMCAPIIASVLTGARPPAGRRRPVRASMDLYRKILERIEANDYDNFRKRAYVSKFEKLLTLPSSYLKCLEADKAARKA